MTREMSVLAAFGERKSQNYLKVRVGHGTCPRVPCKLELSVDLLPGTWYTGISKRFQTLNRSGGFHMIRYKE